MPLDSLGETNLWEKLYEQTPTIIRWALGVLSLGAITMGMAYWRWRQKHIREELSRVENKIDEANEVRRQEVRDLHKRIDHSDELVTQRLDQVNHHLIEIARNTRSQRRAED